MAHWSGREQCGGSGWKITVGGKRNEMCECEGTSESGNGKMEEKRGLLSPSFFLTFALRT